MTRSHNQQPDPPATAGTRPGAFNPMARLLERSLTADDLRDATTRVGQPVAAGTKDAVGLLIFLLAEEPLALRAGHVRRVTRPVRIHRVPHRTNTIFRGLGNVEGKLLLCADLRALLDLAALPDVPDSQADQRRRAIVVGDGQDNWSFEVDAVQGVVPIDPTTAMRPPATVVHARDRYTEALVPLGNDQTTLLDASRIRAGFKAALS